MSAAFGLPAAAFPVSSSRNASQGGQCRRAIATHPRLPAACSLPATGPESGSRRKREDILRGVPSFSVTPFPWPFPEKAVPQDGKRLGCVKKARCLSAASLGPLASQPLSKAFAGLGPRLFRFLFGQCKKEQADSALAKSDHCSATGNVSTFAKRCKSRQKNCAPMLQGTGGAAGWLNRPKLALLKHRRFLTPTSHPAACGPSPSRNGAGERRTENGVAEGTKTFFVAFHRSRHHASLVLFW